MVRKQRRQGKRVRPAQDASNAQVGAGVSGAGASTRATLASAWAAAWTAAWDVAGAMGGMVWDEVRKVGFLRTTWELWKADWSGTARRRPW